MQQLANTFKTALNCDTLRQMAECLESGRRVLSLSGAVSGAKSLAIAKAILTEQRPAAILTATNEEARQIAQEVRFYLDLFSPVPVIELPSLEVDPYRGLSPHPEIAAARAQALWQLLQDGPRIMVASARAAAVRLPDPQRFFARCLQLKQGENCSLENLRQHLLESGYVENDPITGPGEFSVRGGILDVFSPQMENPARLEFFGDTLESVRSFDLDSQRSIGSTEHIEIIPMREYCPGNEIFRHWADQVPGMWSEPYQKHLHEELAMARAGEPFPGHEFLLPAIDPLENSLFDYLKGFRIIVCEKEFIQTTIDKFHADLYDRYLDRIEALKPVLSPKQIYLTGDEMHNSLLNFPRLDVEELNIEEPEGPHFYLSSQATRKYHGNIRELINDLRAQRQSGEKIAFLFSNLGRAERMHDILKEYEIPAHLCRAEEAADSQAGGEQTVLLGVGSIVSGYYLPSVDLRVLSSHDVFDEAEIGVAPRKKKGPQRNLFISDFRDLKPGDYVVHIDHGIGQFQGLKNIDLQEGAKEFALLTYQDSARLYVPVERLDLIQKYSNVGGARPALDRLGGTSWLKTKARIKKSMRDMAAELLKLYAERQIAPGYSYSPDTPWQQEFEDAFEFELTQDQADAISAVKDDMEAARPMDRLLCGDVGYGKTEVAMRAAFKAVLDGKQAAVLAPTTVLAFQHYNTFMQRFTAFPARIQLISRFRSAREQKQILEELESGRID
ncbi:MAG: transcription-repair coupling factor, partial [Acidobacteria bacterium]|nr:transcription-repair coupling factor [Acidobacteriota bacterium]